MHLIIAATLTAQAAAGLIPQPLFTPGERAALSQQAWQDCGYATPQALIPLIGDKRDNTLLCFVRATAKRSGALLSKEIEPGATITSASEFQGMLIFIVQLEANHPRALAQEEETTDFDESLSNRTCQDRWLGGLIDAGMDDGKQARTAIVYQYQDKKRATLAATAVAQCFDPMEKAKGRSK